MDYKIHTKDIEHFQKKIFTFYKKNKRVLPWRNTNNPYKILISEYMLQQTQVNRVIDYYSRWIDQWPTIDDLSRASFYDVVSSWIGLGYNRRAKYLHDTIKKIVYDFDSDVLKAMKSYDKLPGIGRYTSQAVRIFAGNENIPTVDTNIRRIFIHEFNLNESISEKDLYDIAQQCLPKGKSRIWHNALMDYGSLVLTSNNTGIKPKTKQSTFHGSNRQIRGQILRILLNNKKTFEELKVELHIEEERLYDILEKLIRDKIIQYKKDYYYVTNK